MAFKVKDDRLFMDRWPYVAMDKGVHCLGGAMIVFVVELMLKVAGVGQLTGMATAFVVSVFGSVVVELVDGFGEDGFGEDGFSKQDLTYGVVGAGMFTLLYAGRLWGCIG